MELCLHTRCLAPDQKRDQQWARKKEKTRLSPDRPLKVIVGGEPSSSATRVGHAWERNNVPSLYRTGMSDVVERNRHANSSWPFKALGGRGAVRLEASGVVRGETDRPRHPAARKKHENPNIPWYQPPQTAKKRLQCISLRGTSSSATASARPVAVSACAPGPDAAALGHGRLGLGRQARRIDCVELHQLVHVEVPVLRLAEGARRGRVHGHVDGMLRVHLV